ncbi:MAG: hypothetical protein K6G61_04965 [Solobacterium sp.]|nr:hypothetical protein [Solobacterium sp.]
MKITKNDVIRWLYAYVLPFAFMFVFYKKYGLYYNTNDDQALRAMASGLFDGVCEPHLIFMKYTFGQVLAFLYRTFSALDWYGIILCAVMYISLCAVISRLLKRCSGFFTMTGAALLVYGITVLTVLLESVSFQWTVISAFAGAAGMFLYYTDDKNSTANIILVVFLFYMSYVIRYKCFYMMTPVIGLLVLKKGGITGKLFGKDKDAKPRMKVLIAMAVFAALFAGTEFIEKKAYDTPEWQAYNEYNYARSDLMDYYGFPAYTDNQEFYEANGISYEEFTVIKRYGLNFIDDLDAAKLRVIADYAEAQFTEEPAFSRIQSALVECMDTLLARQSIFLTLLSLVLALAVLYAYKSDLSVQVTEILISCGILAMCVYLCWSGRFPLRVSMGLMFIHAMASLALLYGKIEFAPLKLNLFTAVCVLLFAVMCGTELLTIRNEAYRLKNEDSIYNTWYDLSVQHPENNYIYEIYLETPHRFTFAFSGDDSNVFSVGGWTSKTAFRRRQMEKADAEHLSDILFKENTYYVSYATEKVEYIRNYFDSIGRPCRIELIEKLHPELDPGRTVSVFRFVTE